MNQGGGVLPQEHARLLFPPCTPLQRFGSACLDLLYPPHCIVCDASLAPGENQALCRECAPRVRWIGADCCTGCGARVGQGRGRVEECPACRSHPLVRIRTAACVAEFHGLSRALIHAFKFARQYQLGPPLAALMLLRLRQMGQVPEQPVFVPAPFSNRSFLEHGWNPAEELAELLARETGGRLEPHLLKKTRVTPPQATLKREARRKNLNGAFAVCPRALKRTGSRPVVLVDDVITTGATLIECGRTLHAAGVKAITAVAFARS